MAAPGPYREAGGADPMAPSGCALKSAGTRKSSKYLARRLATAGLKLAAVMMTRTRIIRRCTRVKFTLFRCTLADLFFFCCDYVAAPRQRPGHHDQVPAKNNERRRGHRPRRTRIVQRCTRVKFILFRCTSTEFFFSCCESAAAPRQRPGRHDQVPAKIIEQRFGRRPRQHGQVPATHNGCRRGQRPGQNAQLPARRRGQRPCATMKYLRRTTSAVAGEGLGTASNEHSPLCTTSAAAGNGLGTTMKYQQRTTSGAAGNGRALRPRTCDAQRAAPRATAFEPRPSTCAPPRGST
jgi:hypothetical protein